MSDEVTPGPDIKGPDIKGPDIKGPDIKGPDLKKGRPTPKRSEAQRRRGPVAPPPATRREAAKRMRAQQLEARAGRGPALSPEEGYLLKRDKGPVRALVRDIVDGRRNLGVLLLPFAIAVVLAQLTRNEVLIAAVLRVYPVTLILVVVDSVLLVRQVSRAIKAGAPDDRVGALRHGGYAVLRSTVLRRFRMPKPRVAAPALFSRRR